MNRMDEPERRATTSERRAESRRRTSSSARARTSSRDGRAPSSTIRPLMPLRRPGRLGGPDAEPSSRADGRARAAPRSTRSRGSDRDAEPERARRAGARGGSGRRATSTRSARSTRRVSSRSRPAYPCSRARRGASAVPSASSSAASTATSPAGCSSPRSTSSSAAGSTRLDHGDARPGRIRAADRRDGAREDAPVRLHRRARLRDPRRHAAFRLRRQRGGLRAPARRDRDGRPRGVRRAHPRPPGSGGAALRQGRRGGAARRSRWPTCSRTSEQRRPADAGYEAPRRPVSRSRSLHAAACPGSAQSAGRSRRPGTTGRTRWSPRSGASTRTSSASGSSSTESRPATTCARAASRPARSQGRLTRPAADCPGRRQPASSVATRLAPVRRGCIVLRRDRPRARRDDDRAIAAVAGRAVDESFGVVDQAGRRGPLRLLTRAAPVPASVSARPTAASRWSSTSSSTTGSTSAR